MLFDSLKIKKRNFVSCVSADLEDCPSSKGNQAPHPKFERPNGKKHKILIFTLISQELVRPAHLKGQ